MFYATMKVLYVLLFTTFTSTLNPVARMIPGIGIGGTSNLDISRSISHLKLRKHVRIRQNVELWKVLRPDKAGKRLYVATK